MNNGIFSDEWITPNHTIYIFYVFVFFFVFEKADEHCFGFGIIVLRKNHLFYDLTALCLIKNFLFFVIIH
jgi:hypothetical protein